MLSFPTGSKSRELCSGLFDLHLSLFPLRAAASHTRVQRWDEAAESADARTPEDNGVHAALPGDCSSSVPLVSFLHLPPPLSGRLLFSCDPPEPLLKWALGHALLKLSGFLSFLLRKWALEMLINLPKDSNS